MKRGTKFRLYEGFHFQLNAEQVASLSEAFAELEADAGEKGALLAQVWETDDGVFCCCNFVPEVRVNIIKQVLNRRDILAVQIDGTAS